MTENRPLDATARQVESVSKLALVVTTASFAIGLLIVNIHLAKYGLYSNEFLRSDYVLAGVCFFALFAITDFCMGYFIQLVTYAVSASRHKQYIRAVGAVLIGVILVFFFTGAGISMLVDNPAPPLRQLGTLAAIVILTWGLIKGLAMHVNAILDGTPPEELEGDLLKIRPVYHFRIYMLVILSLSGTIIYATKVFPYISPVYGGGKMEQVLLYPNARGEALFKTLSVARNADKTVGPVEVLAKSEKTLTILVPSSVPGKTSATEINRDLLDAVQTASQ